MELQHSTHSTQTTGRAQSVKGFGNFVPEEEKRAGVNKERGKKRTKRRSREARSRWDDLI